VNREENLGWERRWAGRVGAAALVAAVMPIVGFLLQAGAFADRPPGDRGVLQVLDEKAGAVLGASVAQIASSVLASLVLFYLFRAAAHRSDLPQGIQWVILVAPILAGVGLIWTQLDVISIAHDFVDSGEQSERRADNLLENRGQAPLILGLAGNLALAFSFVFTSLHSMRTGLLSRFMGILGIITGALIILPLAPGLPSIVQLFWLIALGLLILGRWPGQRGPAWETGESVPWPTAAQLAAARAGEQEEPDAGQGEPDAPATRPSRKRKRRR